MTGIVLPKVKIEELTEDGKTFYRARVQVKGSPRFHIADAKNASEALLLVAARWHAYNGVHPLT
ncbi:hypothetical protein G8E10_09520 [Rhizobiaceae bacterium CRRU44]|uniref:Uncharacterized protein n=1 Tax=Ferranicluibacter rubi TaxID=2715133 RepID=A0AA44CCE3_9HYPH|nr:hypothetical protein [Ferranicluibacter rubi]NHT75917.1 hypothetical protein [Ferranicluibacter rubi]NHT75977.1 hypothetical protein [Ferranicluibacter rubi]